MFSLILLQFPAGSENETEKDGLTGEKHMDFI